MAAGDLYSRMQLRASQLIGAYGREMARVDRTDGEYDPVAGKRTAGTAVETAFRGLVEESKIGGGDAESLARDSSMAVLAALDSPPLLGSTHVRVGTEEYEVTSYEAIQPGPTAIVYRLMLER